MTRQEHVEWCKRRAHEYLDRGDVKNAVTSMMSDMDKHPECKVPQALTMFAMMAIMNNDRVEAKRFIDGFN